VGELIISPLVYVHRKSYKVLLTANFIKNLTFCAGYFEGAIYRRLYRIAGKFWREKFLEISEKTNDFRKYFSAYSLFLLAFR